MPSTIASRSSYVAANFRPQNTRSSHFYWDNTAEKFNNTIESLKEIAAGRPYDAAAAQVAFAISAMHTTPELSKQALLDICMHQELIPVIRD